MVLTAQATQEADPANVSAVCITKGGRVYDQVLRDLWGILQLWRGNISLWASGKFSNLGVKIFGGLFKVEDLMC